MGKRPYFAGTGEGDGAVQGSGGDLRDLMGVNDIALRSFLKRPRLYARVRARRRPARPFRRTYHQPRPGGAAGAAGTHTPRSSRGSAGWLRYRTEPGLELMPGLPAACPPATTDRPRARCPDPPRRRAHA